MPTPFSEENNRNVEQSSTPRLCPATAGCSPLSMLSIVLCLLRSCSKWFPPASAMSSCPLLLDCRIDLFLSLVTHSMQRLDQLLSFILAICLASFYFRFIVFSVMSIIFVLFLISEHSISSCIFRYNIFLSIALWAVLTLLSVVY